MGTPYQGRGVSRKSIGNVVRYLRANPASTAQQVMAGTKLSSPTVRPLLERVADYDPEVWPRTWTLKPSFTSYSAEREEIPVELYNQSPKLKVPKPGEFGPGGLRKVWPAWIKLHQTWPQLIAKLSRETNPAEIARKLDALASTAATMAQAFRQVKDEPDWLERLGGK